MSAHGPWGSGINMNRGYWLDVRGLVACDHIDAVFLAHNAPLASRILRDPAIEDVYDAIRRKFGPCDKRERENPY